MAHQSDPSFRAFHALRIKGFAKSDMVADIAAITVAEAEAELAALKDKEFALFREARSLWQITPAGKEVPMYKVLPVHSRNRDPVGVSISRPIFTAAVSVGSSKAPAAVTASKPMSAWPRPRLRRNQ